MGPLALEELSCVLQEWGDDYLDLLVLFVVEWVRSGGGEEEEEEEEEEERESR